MSTGNENVHPLVFQGRIESQKLRPELRIIVPPIPVPISTTSLGRLVRVGYEMPPWAHVEWLVSSLRYCGTFRRPGVAGGPRSMVVIYPWVDSLALAYSVFTLPPVHHGGVLLSRHMPSPWCYTSPHTVPKVVEPSCHGPKSLKP